MTDARNIPEPAGSTQPTADLSSAVLPTAATLRRRQSIPIQLGKFVLFNVRMLRLVLKSGH